MQEKMDEVISDNMKQFVSTNLNESSNNALDAKFTIAKASLGTNPMNFTKIKVRLGTSNRMCHRIIN